MIPKSKSRLSWQLTSHPLPQTPSYLQLKIHKITNFSLWPSPMHIWHTDGRNNLNFVNIMVTAFKLPVGPHHSSE